MTFIRQVWIARLLLLSTLLVFVGCDGPVLPPIPKDGTILAFGDSLTAGIGAKHTNYPAQLSKRTGLRVINAGVSGETTAEGLPRLRQLLTNVKPDVLILLEGGNDILQKRNLATTKANLAAMIELAEAQQIAVVLIGVPTRLLFSDAAPFYQELADQYGLVYEDKMIGRLLREPSLKSDQVHFNDAGYQAMAESIYTLLMDHGALAYTK